MNLIGLNGNRYLVNNKILVTMSLDGGEVFNYGSEINLNITRNSDSYSLPSIRLYPTPEGLTIDLAPYIKGLMKKPYVPGNSYADPIPNSETFTITFEENQTNSSNTFLNKTFVRGGRRVTTNDSQKMLSRFLNY